MRRLATAWAAAVIGWSQNAAAQSGPLDPPTAVSGVTVTARRATQVDGVTVNGSRCTPAAIMVDPEAKPPAVVSTYPGPESQVAPGFLALRIGFDQPMSDCSFAYGPDFPLKFPVLAGHPPVLLPGGRVFLLLVQVKADARYGVRLNAPPHGFFISRAGLAAAPVELRFTTSTAAPLTAEQAAAVSAQAQLPPTPPSAS